MNEVKFDSSGKITLLDNSGKIALFEPIRDESYWSLQAGTKILEPLKFSNGKNQEDVVKEVVRLVKSGKKIILIHGVCGTGKSAIALNIARILGKTSLVVPIKSLQQQYEQDYMKNKHVLKRDGSRLKIAMITGRDNHDSIIKPGATCADPFLPETIKLNEKNMHSIRQFYDENPLVSSESGNIDLKDIKRISIAPANPYWSPILPAHFEVPLDDAAKKRYRGLGGKDFIFYHRKHGCTYYDQYQAYLDADVIIFNAAKYKIETALDRKPATEIEIIDEADEFLDNFSNQESINLTRLGNALQMIQTDDSKVKEAIKQIIQYIGYEERNKHALGIKEDEIHGLDSTQVQSILSLMLDHPEIEDEAHLDEYNYVSHAVEVAKTFESFFEDTYVTFRKEDDNLIVNLVTTNLSEQVKKIVEKNKVLILMTGTPHSPIVMKEIFGISGYAVVEAETKAPGVIEIMRTGKEFDCKYSNFSSGEKTRKDYLEALSSCVSKAKLPVLIHVGAFEDLPSISEQHEFDVSNVMSKEELRETQANDKNSNQVKLFKAKLKDRLFTTKCSRGVDFPGDTCNSVIFTKYPNPNPNDVFWKVLKQNYPKYFWDFYKDKASREVLQRTYRALRSENDHVYVLSPDTRVLEAIRDLQRRIVRGIIN